VTTSAAGHAKKAAIANECEAILAHHAKSFRWASWFLPRRMRLDASIPSKPADFQALRGVVLQDWTDATAAEQRSQAVHALAKKYKITYETPAPGSAE
jgi:hypothetical protein